MAVIEIQFREQVFFKIIGALISRAEYPKELFSLPAERLIEKVVSGDIGYQNPEHPAMSQASPQQVLFNVPFKLLHTTFQDAKAAGSLIAPQCLELNCDMNLILETTAAGQIKYTANFLRVNGQQVPFLFSSELPIGHMPFPIASSQFFSGAGVVALRLATSAADSLEREASNKIGNYDWGFFPDGQLFADQLAETLNAAGQDAISGSSDPILEIDYEASGSWGLDLLGNIAAFASLGINAVDAAPLNIDVPVKISAMTTIKPDPYFVNLVLETKVQWDASGIIGYVPGVQGKVNDAIRAKLHTPSGLKEIARSDEYVIYQSTIDVFKLKTDFFYTEVHGVAVKTYGLEVTGSLTVYPPPTAAFILEEQHWTRKIDCTSKTMKTEFHPPLLHILSSERVLMLKTRTTPVVDPAGFWQPEVRTSGLAHGAQVVDVTFDPGQNNNPVGARSSAFIESNMGVRYVDLGAVPGRPRPTMDNVAEQAQVISECMAKSDRWGMGVLNLEWLVDPPAYQFGIANLREWTISADHIESDHMEVFAVGPLGERKINMVLDQSRNEMHVITAADESLQLKNVSLQAEHPHLFQRWITPWASIPSEDNSTPLGMIDNKVYLNHGSEIASVTVPPFVVDESPRNPVSRPRISKISEETMQKLKSSPTFFMANSEEANAIMSVAHKGAIYFGLAGKQIEV